jgi:hypothetical protein
MTAGGGSKPFPWLACGIGCGIVLLLLVVVAVSVVFAGSRIIRETRGELTEQVLADYEEAKGSGTVSEEEMQVYDELVSLWQRPETGPMMWGASGMLLKVAIDGTPEEKERALEAATELRDMLREDASPGMAKLGEFMNKHTFDEDFGRVMERMADEEAEPEGTEEDHTENEDAQEEGGEDTAVAM